MNHLKHFIRSQSYLENENLKYNLLSNILNIAMLFRELLKNLYTTFSYTLF